MNYWLLIPEILFYLIFAAWCIRQLRDLDRMKKHREAEHVKFLELIETYKKRIEERDLEVSRKLHNGKHSHPKA